MNAFGNARWVALSQLSKIVAQVVIAFVLAKLLPPAEYGVIAMAGIVTAFAMLFRDMGVTAVIIQRAELTSDLMNTAFRLSLVSSLAVGAIIAASSPLVSAYFRESALTPVLVLLGISFPLSGMVAVNQALLERESAFKKLARIEVVANLTGAIASVLAALAGAGVFSLVVLVLVTGILSLVQMVFASPWRPGPLTRAERGRYREVLSFSASVVGFNIVNYFSRNADGLIIGRLYSASILGAYSLAYRIMLFPLQSLTFVATRSLFPVLADRLRRGESLQAPYLAVVESISLIVAPMMAGLYLVREQVIGMVFGEQWGLTSELLKWFALTGFLQSVMSISGVVFMATNKAGLLLRLGCIGAFLQVGAFVLAAPYGVERMAELYLYANVINFVLVMAVCTRTVGAGFSRTLFVMGRSAACALLMMLALALVFDAGLASSGSSLLWLVSVILSGSIVYCVLCLVLVPSVRALLVARARKLLVAKTGV